MNSKISLTPEFVELLPENLEEGKIYLSMKYATVMHKCCCGCGNEVVTPLSPTEWKLFFDGETISLRPSIGNWDFPCQSHYWVKENEIEWAGQWSRHQIESGRAKEALAKKKYLDAKAKDRAERLDVDEIQSSLSDPCKDLASAEEKIQPTETVADVASLPNQQPKTWLQKVKSLVWDRFFK